MQMTGHFSLLNYTYIFLISPTLFIFMSKVNFKEFIFSMDQANVIHFYV